MEELVYSNAKFVMSERSKKAKKDRAGDDDDNAAVERRPLQCKNSCQGAKECITCKAVLTLATRCNSSSDKCGTCARDVRDASEDEKRLKARDNAKLIETRIRNMRRAVQDETIPNITSFAKKLEALKEPVRRVKQPAAAECPPAPEKFDTDELRYIWALLWAGKNILIMGPPGCGKVSMTKLFHILLICYVMLFVVSFVFIRRRSCLVQSHTVGLIKDFKAGVLLTAYTNAQAEAMGCPTVFSAMGVGLLDKPAGEYVRSIKHVANGEKVNMRLCALVS